MAAASIAEICPAPELLIEAEGMPSASEETSCRLGFTAMGNLGGEDAMQTPQDVEQMGRLHGMGWSQRAIAHELGCCPRMVRRYLRQGGWKPYGKPRRSRRLDEQLEWLRAKFEKHRGNGEVLQTGSSRPADMGT